MIRFVHIPKTGGTTFTKLLSILNMKFNISFVSKQACYNDLAVQGDYNMVFLRSPVHHVKSQFLECRDDSAWGQRVRSKDFPHTSNESSDYWSWLRHFQRLTPAEVGSTYDFRCQDPRNTLTRHLSCTHPVERGHGGHPPNHALDQPIDLARAMQNLDAASFVGITEFMPQSVCMFNKSFPFVAEIPHVRHGVEDSHSRLNSQDYDSLVTSLAPHDFVLYDYAMSIFMRQLHDHPDCI